MNLKQQIEQDFIYALKNKDKSLAVLRMLKNSIKKMPLNI